MNPMIKIALFAGVALWLLRDQIAEAMGTESTPDQPQPQPSAPAPATQQPPPAAAPAAPQPPLPSGTVLERAATNSRWAPAAGDTRLSIDEWNWYRNAYRRNVVNLPEIAYEAPESYLPAGTPRDVRITAVEYHRYRAAAGLSGVSARAWGA
jgi:hypothetical protein